MDRRSSLKAYSKWWSQWQLIAALSLHQGYVPREVTCVPIFGPTPMPMKAALSGLSELKNKQNKVHKVMERKWQWWRKNWEERRHDGRF